ncbi:MAG: hypothetical protein JRJ12_04830 [Deltaproteobacteria bacterium]|nr:hypothetical protein [Deltaproteobacteria bacterium]MBW2072075.1 hypothetical protein [Deltaproteobacteria bacterium]
MFLFGGAAVTLAEPLDSQTIVSLEQTRASGVPEAILKRVLAAASDHSLPNKDLAALLVILREAQQEDIPVAPLAAKVEEGLVKHVPPEVIIRVLRQKCGDYRFVRQIFMNTDAAKSGSRLSADDFTRLVTSLDAGLTRQELQEFITSAPVAPPPMLARAVEVFALLRQINYDATLARDVLYTGLSHQSFTQPWTYLARVVSAARKRGISDHKIAAAASEALEQERPMRDFMTTIGFTSRDMRHGPARGGQIK